LVLSLGLVLIGFRGLVASPHHLEARSGHFGDIESRVINGSLAELGEFPHMAILTYNGRFLCGGSILDKRRILSAGHCFEDEPEASRFSAIVGVNSRTDISSGQQIKGERYVVHPEYETENETQAPVNDVAILFLAEDIQFNTRVQPIALPTPDHHGDFENQTAIVSGWGVYDPKKGSSVALLKASLRVYPLAKCIEDWKVKKNSTVGAYNLCTFTKFHGPCFGDSGGPLQLKSPDGSGWLQIGIVSTGEDSCDKLDLPDVFTRVTTFAQWINATRLN